MLKAHSTSGRMDSTGSQLLASSFFFSPFVFPLSPPVFTLSALHIDPNVHVGEKLQCSRSSGTHTDTEHLLQLQLNETNLIFPVRLVNSFCSAFRNLLLDKAAHIKFSYPFLP